MVRKVYPERHQSPRRRPVAGAARRSSARYGPSVASWAPYEGRRGFLSGARPSREQRAAAAAWGGPAWPGPAVPGGPVVWQNIGGRLVPVQTQVAPMLPTLNPHLTGGIPAAGAGVPGAAAAGPAGVVPRRPGEDLERAGRWLWAHRWPLTPPAAVGGAAAAAVLAPGLATAAAVAASGGLWAWTRHGRPIRDRMWLSVRERRAAATWCTAAAAWTPLAAALPLPVGIEALGLLGAAAWPAWVWWTSRRIRPAEAPAEPGMSAQAAELVAAWPATIAATGPEQLRGSRIVAETMSEPAPGSYAFAVELAEAVHAQDAAGDAVRRYLERALRLPVGTAALEADRDDCARLRITLTPTRHLERVDAPWPGPVLADDGTFPLALCPDGKSVDGAAWNERGVEHFFVVGTTGAGKSVTTGALLLPGVMNRREVVFYVDGGTGASAAHLAGAMDWWAVTEQEWVAAIECAYAVLKDRKARRGAMGLSSWRGAAERDPILTLYLEEATTVLETLAPKVRDRLAAMAREIAREGRKFGVRFGQAVQDPMGTDTLGGRKVKGLLSGGGTVVGHRPGDKTAAFLSVGSTAEKIDLTALPGEPGWAAVIRRGQVLSRAARIRHASEDAVTAVLEGFVPRGLDGSDAAAAGAVYAARTHGVDAAARMREARQAEAAGRDPRTVGEQTTTAAPADVELLALGEHQAGTGPVEALQDAPATSPGSLVPGPRLNAGAQAARAEAEANRAAVLDALAEGPCARIDLVRATGLGRTTIGRILADLAQAEAITRTPDHKWTLTTAATSDDTGHAA